MEVDLLCFLVWDFGVWSCDFFASEESAEKENEAYL